MSCRRTDDKVECAFSEPGDFDVYFISQNGTHRKVLSCMWVDELYHCIAALGFKSTDGSVNVPVLTVPDTLQENGHFLCQTGHTRATDVCAWYPQEKSLTTYTSKSETDIYTTPAGMDDLSKYPDWTAATLILGFVLFFLFVSRSVMGIYRVQRRSKATKLLSWEKGFPRACLGAKAPVKRTPQNFKNGNTERDEEMVMLDERHKAEMPFEELSSNISTNKDEAEKFTTDTLNTEELRPLNRPALSSEISSYSLYST